MNAKPTPATTGDAYTNVQDMPPALVSGLKMMINRVRRIMWIRGTVATAAVLLFSMLAIMAVDATTMLESSAVRWSLWGTGLLFTLVTAWTMLVKPLSRPLSITKMARVLETRHPDLQERISSVIQLKGYKGYGQSAGSAALLDILTRDALLDMESVSPRHEFTFRSAKPFLGALTISSVVLASLMVVWPRQTIALITRAASPVANVNTIGAIGLDVQPGDVSRLRGTPITITISAPRDEKPTYSPELRIRRADGRRVNERMRITSAPNDAFVTYALTFPAVTESFSYQIQFSATALTRSYNVTVLPPPEIEELTIAYEFPEYTGLGSTQFVYRALADITALAGTRMRMTAKLNTPADGTLLLGSWRLHGERVKNTLDWQAVLTTNAAPRYAIAMRDVENGFTNDLAFARVRIFEDQPPTIEQIAPAAYRFTVTPYTRVSFAYDMFDDFGIASARMIIRNTERAIVKTIPLEVNRVGRRTWHTTLTLIMQGIPAGQTYTVTCEATDNFPASLGGPHVVESIPVSLTVKDVNPIDVRSITEQVIIEQAKVLKDLIDFAARSLEASSSNVQSARDRLGEMEPENAAIILVNTAIGNAKDANEALAEAVEFAGSSIFKIMAVKILNVNSQYVNPAHRNINNIWGHEFSARQQKADESVVELKNAAEKVRELLEELEELEKKALELAELMELAKKEMELAQDAKKDEAMTDKEMDDWMKEQEKLLDDATKKDLDDDILKKMQDALDAMKKNDPMDQQKKEEAEKLLNAALETKEAAKQALDAAIKAEDLANDRDNAEKAKDAAQAIMDAADKIMDSADDTKAAPEAEDTQAKLDEAADKAQEAADMADKAANDAKQAAEELKNPTLADAAQDLRTAADLAKDAAKDAKDAADMMRDAMNEQQNGDPDKGAEDQAAAEQKAQDAKDKAEQAKEMAKDAADAIGNELDRMEKSAQDAADKAQQMSQQAQQNNQNIPPNDNLQNAQDLTQKAADGAKEAIEQSNEGENAQDQKEAGDTARQAQEDAKAAMDAADAAAKDAKDAMEAGEQQKQAGEDAQEAAEAMGEQAMEMGKEMGLDMQPGPPMPGMPMPGQKPGEEPGEEGKAVRKPGDNTVVSGNLFNVNRMVRPDWMRTKGEAQADALDAALQNVPTEYRDLVKAYFEQLSREAR